MKARGARVKGGRFPSLVMVGLVRLVPAIHVFSLVRCGFSRLQEQPLPPAGDRAPRDARDS